MATDPGYNEPVPKKSNTLWYVLGSVLVVGFLFCCVCPGGFFGYTMYNSSRMEQRVTDEPGTPVTAAALVAAADTTYHDKVVIVSGKVTSKSILGVTLDNSVSCLNATTPNTEAFQKLNIGDAVKIKGICQGHIGSTVQVANGRLVP